MDRGGAQYTDLETVELRLPCLQPLAAGVDHDDLVTKRWASGDQVRDDRKRLRAGTDDAHFRVTADLLGA